MTPRLVGGIAAATLALGVVTGAAGTIIARDATTPPSDFAAIMADHMTGAGMGSMMSGSMMRPGSSFGPGMMGGPAVSSMPGGQHDLHHPAASPDGSK